MNISDIEHVMEGAIAVRGCFLVGVEISKNNEIELTVESEAGVVTLDDCVALSHFFEAQFDREAEDYELTVSSAGLDQPFKVLKQYLKAVGSKVEVSLRGGKRFVATLLSASEAGVCLGYSAKEAVEGSKKKVVVNHEDQVAYGEITAMRPYVEF